MAELGSARVDAWLWAVRVCKTRSAATAACRAGHVRVNGERAKAALPVRPGDEVRVRLHGFDRILIVRRPIVKRVSAEVAATAAEDRTPPHRRARRCRRWRCASAARVARRSASDATSTACAVADGAGRSLKR